MSKQKNHNTPPRWSLRLLRYFLRNDLLEEIEGDMAEIYADSVEQYGKSKANQNYTKEVLKLLRPILIKKISSNHPLNQFGMFKNYFKTSLRSLKKNTLFSTINIAGLAISMSVGILMIIFLSEIYAVDSFHEQKDRIYKVTSTQVQGRENQLINSSSASYYIGDQLKTQVPGVEQVVILRDTKASFDLSNDDKAVPISGYYAGASFFTLFSFELLQGNLETALSTPNSIVLTTTAAKRLFGDENPLGQLVKAQQSQYSQSGRTAATDFSEGMVTGIIQDPPANSHLQFEMLISLSTLDRRAQIENSNFKTNPGNTNHIVYLLLNESAIADQVENAAMDIIANYNTTRDDNPMIHHLQPMDEFFTSDTYHTVGPSFSQERIYLMLGLTLIVLLSACFNYTNLSLARALRRSKEVGIRKVAGATRYQVFSQFMVEAVVLSLFAMLSGFVLFYLLKPEFLKLAPSSLQGYQMFSLEIENWHLLVFFLFAISVGLIAGFLPALFHSKLRTASAFQDKSKLKVFSGMNLRRALIVGQFALSIGLIMTAVLVNNQYQYTLAYDLGYETENILTIDINGDYIELLENEYSKMSEVVETSKSSWILGVGGNGLSAGMIQPEDRKGRAVSLINEVDQDYLAMHNLRFLEGSNFLSPLAEGEAAKYVIVNEGLLEQLTLGTPEEAIGKSLWYNGQKVAIQGVIEDAVSIGLTKNIFDSFVFVQTNQPDRYKSLNLKVQNTDVAALLDKMEAVYTIQDPVHPFKASFYDDKIAASYQSDKANFTIVSFLALLSVSISTLGLLGMAVFTTETRLKEISIRKVLGANIANLMLLLSKNFLLLIVIAGLIAIPATWHIVDTQVLNDFWQRADPGLVETLSGLIIVLAISMLTIGWQIRQAAIKNPADLLRND